METEGTGGCVSPVMRFAIRDDGTLVVGIMMKNPSDFFKPGHVYEVIEVEGEPTIVDLGESAIGSTIKDGDEGVGCCWGNSVSQVVQTGHHLFSKKEWAQKMAKSNHSSG